ncbi:MAG: hypothetical protein Q6355_01725 [Candidatus Brocadiales bacterium]|uniref:hypothetical protein n=1 Tax=Candidatus Wujingus californicus TaxID=3367618 RepID=UPI001DECD903|nr:hypothetical protein [Planctomycetota bacterium]MDO8130596.1 hypothetical protein [Candidatus Brocadiales bacterium]
MRKNFEAVIQKVSFFELACEIILRAGEQIQFLSEDAITCLRPQTIRCCGKRKLEPSSSRHYSILIKTLFFNTQ